VLRSQRKVFFGIETHHLAGPGAASSPGSLSCGRLADPTDLQRRQSSPGASRLRCAPDRCRPPQSLLRQSQSFQQHSSRG
jgi:hypothetical protein